MHRLATTLASLLTLAAIAATPAMAQQHTVESDDAAYCKKLASLQERYGRSANTSNSMDTNTALNSCSNARAAEAIVHLEKLLKAAGYSLPERSVGSRRH
ncbi:hypothetical protein [Reyranella sp. CPCC 100927]|uniref:hypothetical protein n=1 Tax=Reyranella sp. CPCC 100927 TaxID=2599616 RepID=UPI0011B7A6C0|nr:hypothetical protein [Reyranella sp. CPCC 100927]TWS98316.1 hypothetical protein FQU96_36450 [Reyranella sp. CPCC 100927]